jgi:hypothetical protein
MANLRSSAARIDFGEVILTAFCLALWLGVMWMLVSVVEWVSRTAHS